MRIKTFFLYFFCFLLFPTIAHGSINELKGRILLQVEARGEAWYVNPSNSVRYYLGRPADAFKTIRELGAGIKTADLEKIPNAGDEGKEAAKTDKRFIEKSKGKIFLQVEARGEAWYVNPVDGKRYFLGRPDDALNLMRRLGLGITNKELEKIPANISTYPLLVMEKEIQTQVNQERQKNGLPALKWNDELAAVAREHSLNLARENQELTDMYLTCDYPLIHHEGFDFGAYHGDRLETRGVYYFSQSGENIALMPAAQRMVTYSESDADIIGKKLDDCRQNQESANDNIKEKTENASLSQAQKLEAITKDIAWRKEKLKQEMKTAVSKIQWSQPAEIEAKTVGGWMASPGHRANILRTGFDEAGVGLAYVNGYVISTQVFIKRADCGYQTGPCCTKTGYYPYCYSPLECGNGMCRKNGK